MKNRYIDGRYASYNTSSNNIGPPKKSVYDENQMMLRGSGM